MRRLLPPNVADRNGERRHRSPDGALGPTAAKSNYTRLFSGAVTQGQGWVTEFSGGASTLGNIYESTCINQPDVAVPCDANDAGIDASAETDAATEDATDDAAVEASTDEASADDASTDDASDDAASDGDAADGGSVDATPSRVKYVSACSFFDDWDVATTGISTYDVVVTRLRTTLPATALTKDLTLGASVDQSSLPKNITSQGYTVPNYDPCPGATSQPPPAEGCGCDTAGQNDFVVSTSLAGLALVALGRRRRRRS